VNQSKNSPPSKKRKLAALAKRQTVLKCTVNALLLEKCVRLNAPVLAAIITLSTNPYFKKLNALQKLKLIKIIDLRTRAVIARKLNAKRNTVSVIMLV